MQHHQQIMAVPFHGDTVVLFGQNNEPYAAMRPIVENMGLAWAPQYVKLGEKFASTVTIIVTVGDDGRAREMLCMPVRKLPAWLYSINPNKVGPSLRDKIIRYQEECDDVLWDYWTKGYAARAEAIRPREKIALLQHRMDLLRQLQRSTDPLIRGELHHHLTEVSTMLGFAVPALVDVGRANHESSEAWLALLSAVNYLRDQGTEANHSIHGHLLAINRNLLDEALLERGAHFSFSREQWAGLRDCPQLIGVNKAVHSVVAGKSLRCWVFNLEPSER